MGAVQPGLAPQVSRPGPGEVAGRVPAADQRVDLLDGDDGRHEEQVAADEHGGGVHGGAAAPEPGHRGQTSVRWKPCQERLAVGPRWPW